MVYVLWIGLMVGLFLATTSFVVLGHKNGIVWPAYVWNVPLGTFIFLRRHSD